MDRTNTDLRYQQSATDFAGHALPRLLPAGHPADSARLDSHLARHGALPLWSGRRRKRDELIAEVELAGLAGRGGAGFPTARKLAAVAHAGGRPVVIGNGTEGEPASAKDKVLMAQAPHLVLDGAIIAAELTHAREAIIVAHPAVSDIVAEAAAERERAHIDPIRLRVIPAADRFVAGEASAVVRWVQRGIAKPMATRERLSSRGLNGRPTLVQNVETLAHLALIARHGAHWFRAVGTSEEPGSMLVTVTGSVRHPGVHEIAIGTRLADVVEQAGGLTAEPGTLLLGGYFGSWARPADAFDLPFSSRGLAEVGAGLGAGLIAVIPAEVCGLAEAARVTRYLADESAGQCGPCVFGLSSIAGQLERIADRREPDPALSRWLDQMSADRGACKHPDGTVAMVRSALSVFDAEVQRHLRGECTGSRRPDVLPLPLGGD